MMLLDSKPGSIVFRHGESVAGEYHFGDEFKPHFHPLRTPTGHCVTSASPHDHKHHKGLMYALRTKDVNFWEEVATTPDEIAGRQWHLDFHDIVPSGSIVGFTEQLRWSSYDGSLDCFDEVRTLRCIGQRDCHQRSLRSHVVRCPDPTNPNLKQPNENRMLCG